MYTLREANEGDYGFLYDLHRAAMKNYVDQTWGWDEAFQQRMFRESFDPRPLRIVQVAGQDAGVIWVERRPAEIFLSLIEIHPIYQGRGIGTAVVGDIFSEARDAGLPVTLRVLKVNPARKLYERLGFVVVGEIPTHYLMSTAVAQDAADESSMRTLPAICPDSSIRG